MKAIVMEAAGSRQDFVEKEIKQPEIGANEVLIEVYATAINPVDIAVREGQMEPEDGFPTILGADIAGIVADVGKDVSEFQKGDEVFTTKIPGADGGFAEYTKNQAKWVFNKPTELSFEEAATLGIAALTAYQLVNHETHGAKEGETVLIQGGSGGVGTFAIQFAKQKGAKVLATTSRNEDLLKSLGTDEVINYKEVDVPKAYEKEVDYLIDLAGQGTATLPVVKDGGRALTVSTPFLDEEVDKRNITAERMGYKIQPQQLKEFAKQVANKELTIIIDEVFPFTKEGIQAAHELSESGHAAGKIVVKVK